jgi:glutamate formiminotransferase
LSKLVQCTPNFSEGRRAEIVKAIVDAIDAASDARVIDYSMDADHNRAVVTFLGDPQEVRRSIFAGAKAAVELIDLRGHRGEHPRVGAIDVVPLVPVREMTMAEAVALSYEIGKDIADNLHVPVFFYERSAVMRHRQNLADVRKGGFEALNETGLVNGREPDLGPSQLHPTAGAVVIGARGPLIAFNVNLATSDVEVARTIATRMREARDRGDGLPGVKAIAVRLKSRRMTQVSTNITLPRQVSIYDVYAFVEGQAREMGVEVVESELIGAIREESLIDAARSSMKLHGLTEKRLLDHWL